MPSLNFYIMARLFRNQIKSVVVNPFNNSLNSKDMECSCYSVESLLDITAHNKPIPSMKSYSYSLLKPDLRVPVPECDDMCSANALLKKNEQYNQMYDDEQAQRKSLAEKKANEAKEAAIREQIKSELNVSNSSGSAQ